jgi:hypothetical protein
MLLFLQVFVRGHETRVHLFDVLNVLFDFPRRVLVSLPLSFGLLRQGDTRSQVRSQFVPHTAVSTH